MKKVDPIHEQRQREFIISLLRVYGVKKNLDAFDNRALIAMLERALCGIVTK